MAAIVVVLIACSDGEQGAGASAGASAGAGVSAGAGAGAGVSAGAGAGSGSAGTAPGTTDAGAHNAGSGGAGGKLDAAVPAGGHDAAIADDDAGSQTDAAAPTGEPFVYVSGYGSTIHIFELDPQTGALTPRGTADGGDSPSYLAFAPNHKTLYAIDEASPPDSEVIAFAIDQNSGGLTEINRAASGGEGSPHLAVDPSGRWVAVAHYNSGHTTILPVRNDGGVGDVVATKRGPNDDCVNAHQAVFDHGGTHLFVPCLGSNYVQQFKLDSADGSLTYNDPPTVTVAGGPRHMAFDPSEQHAYVLSETESTITSFDYDAASGKLSNPQVINSYQTTKGSSAHIVVHPSGGFLYASNRSEDSIGLFSLAASGRPSAKSFVTDMIAEPRDFTVDPTGTFLLSANQQGAQNVLVFRIDPQNGELTRVQVVPVGDQPSFVGVLTLPGS